MLNNLINVIGFNVDRFLFKGYRKIVISAELSKGTNLLAL